MSTVRVLFVCLGNICRSPMAEAVMRHLAAEAGLGDAIDVDSAGTAAYHVGDSPHPSTSAELQRNGVEVGAQRARQVQIDDLSQFDEVVAMDSDNLDDLQELARAVDKAGARLSLLLPHDASLDELDVPDPYYVGGYDVVYTLVHAGCTALLDHIVDEYGLTPAAQ